MTAKIHQTGSNGHFKPKTFTKLDQRVILTRNVGAKTTTRSLTACLPALGTFVPGTSYDTVLYNKSAFVCPTL